MKQPRLSRTPWLRAAVLALALLVTAAPARAQSDLPGADTPATGATVSTKKFAVGMQSSFPTWGVSGMYHVTDQLSAQAVVDLMGNLTSFGGRVLYRFDQRENFDFYGYGAVGSWRYHWDALGDDYSTSVVGFGGGGGMELDLQRLFTKDGGSFPPLLGNVEVGVTLVNFDDEAAYNMSTFTVGVGLHYSL